VGQRILFRADASSEMGAGHVMRCLALAGELARRGGEVHFACRPFSGNLNELIHSSGYHLHELTPPRDGGGERYAAWLGAGWGEDAKESATVAAVLGGVDWLVVDHYALDARWHRALRGNCRRTLVIDDLADRKYDCDILLDMTLGRQAAEYAERLSGRCRILVGAEYSLLRPQFSDHRERALRRRGVERGVERVLVSMGGGDPFNATGLALEALAPFRIAVDVVLGGQAPHADRVAAQAARMGEQVRVHRQVEDMAALMVEADLAVGTPGTTSWERCCLGLPSLLIITEENQATIAAALDRAGAAWSLGWLKEVSVEWLTSAVEGMIADAEARRQMAEIAARVTDGGGAARVAEAMAA